MEPVRKGLPTGPPIRPSPQLPSTGPACVLSGPFHLCPPPRQPVPQVPPAIFQIAEELMACLCHTTGAFSFYFHSIMRVEDN